MEPTSEQELQQLLDEGKITEDEHQQLKGAMQERQSNKDSKPKTTPESELALRKKLLIYGLSASIFGLPTGLVLGLPYVWGLSIAGIVVGIIKMKKYGIIK